MYGNELYHHGILGMKWGVRRYQNKDGSLTSEGKERYSGNDKRISRISNKYDKKIASVNKERSEIFDARTKNRAKIENIYDRRIEKATKKAATLTAKKDYRLNDFDEGSRLLSSGYDRYIKNISDYKNTRISAINDPSNKQSSAYKEAGRNYTKQVLNDALNYGERTATVLQYMSQEACSES